MALSPTFSLCIALGSLYLCGEKVFAFVNSAENSLTPTATTVPFATRQTYGSHSRRSAVIAEVAVMHMC